MLRISLTAIGLALFLASPVRAIVGEASQVEFSARAGAFPLVAHGRAAAICLDSADWPGVRRAVDDLTADIARVSGLRPDRLSTPRTSPSGPSSPLILIGTLGHSSPIDRLVQSNQLDVSPIQGRWEAWITQTVSHPFPGVDQALVIVGSDKRGTIYGAYDLSQQIGVSPWAWWADVPVPTHPALYFQTGQTVHTSPRVKYRGIFFNDEAPDLTSWVRAKYGNIPVQTNPPIPGGVANYNHEFYTRVFQLMLRLRANYLWPAMWNNAFNEDDPANQRLADEFGIVMGTSHQEPMLRAQKEWDRRYQKTEGTWNYARDPKRLEQFWTEGIQRSRGLESIVTLGLRGANDTEMAPGGPAANRALLEHIVDRQREILKAELNPDLTQIPQMWCLYKEVLDYYDAGMRVPDDVTLLWPEDNWGNLRRVPTAAERHRSGGAGIYYHFDYHGDPRSYQWINTNPLPKIWDQMDLAARAGADRIWIVNVGHLKGYELPTEFFLSLAWDPSRWTAENLSTFVPRWAAREFGPAHAEEIARLVEAYAKYNGRRKPEMLSPTTYSLIDYGEAETVVSDFERLALDSAKLAREMPPAFGNAYYELVDFPIRASALVNRLYWAAGRNELFAGQERLSANREAQSVHDLFGHFQGLMADFNDRLAGGKWAHFMDQPVLGYLNWRDPPTNSLRAIPLQKIAGHPSVSLGFAIEGSDQSWPLSAGAAKLPEFDSLTRQTHYFEVFRRGDTAANFRASGSQPWILLSETRGAVEGSDRRVTVSIDWDRLPPGRSHGLIQVSGASELGSIEVSANQQPAPPSSFHGFVEGSGLVAIEAAHYARKIDAAPGYWREIPDYGSTLSGMRADTTGELDAPTSLLANSTARLEYRVQLSLAGTAKVTAVTAPTLNFVPGRGLRYAISWDDQPPQIITLVPAEFKAMSHNPAWAAAVGNNAHHSQSVHHLDSPGEHVLKFWMVDPGVVLERLIVDLGGVQPSYLGPPESYRVK